MSENKTSTDKPAIDPLLIKAWKRTLDIGSVSSNQKEHYTTLRTAAIVLSLLTTFFAVLSGLSDMLSVELQWAVALFVFIPTLAYIPAYILIIRFSSQRPNLGDLHKKHPIVYIGCILAIALIIIGLIYLGVSIEIPLLFRFIVLALPVLG